jgi:hypothetical protein
MSRRTPQPEDGTLYGEPQRFRRWDEKVIFCGPTRWHDSVRFLFLWSMLKRPAQELPDLKRIGVAAAGTAEQQQEAQAMWEHVEQTLTDWALAEGALRASQSVLPTLLGQRFC